LAAQLRLVYGRFPPLRSSQQGAEVDTRYLTSAQQAEIWRGLGKEAMKTLVLAGLRIGEVVPNTMHLLPFARDLRKKLPMIRPYLYALLHGQVLIIDPRTRKIVSIVVE
jgi:hypothetical protein